MKSISEWKHKSIKTLQLLKNVEQHVHDITPNADVILYGSQARGDARQFSDWDFLILTDQKVDSKLTTKLRDCLYELELETDEILSSIIRTKRDWNSLQYDVLPFKRAVEKEGILL